MKGGVVVGARWRVCEGRGCGWREVVGVCEGRGCGWSEVESV